MTLSTETIPNIPCFKIPLCCVLYSAMAQNVYTPLCRTQYQRTKRAIETTNYVRCCTATDNQTRNPGSCKPDHGCGPVRNNCQHSRHGQPVHLNRIYCLRCGSGLIPALIIFPVYFPPVPVNRYIPFGTAISNRAPHCPTKIYLFSRFDGV